MAVWFFKRFHKWSNVLASSVQNYLQCLTYVCRAILYKKYSYGYTMIKTKEKAILQYADSVRKITRHRFGVDSISDSSKPHTVQRVPQSNIWYCDCAYFHYSITRKGPDERYCHHILACIRHREADLTKRSVERLDNLAYVMIWFII